MRFNSRVLAVSVFTIPVLAFVWVAGFHAPPQVRDLTFVSITDDRGERLDSAFSGISPNLQRLRALRDSLPPPPCPARRSAFQKLVDLFRPAVHAQDNGCQPADGYQQTCVSHYMAAFYPDCGCGDGTQYPWFLPGGRSFSTGWKWDGNTTCTTCQGAQCEEGQCFNYGGCTQLSDCADQNMQCINGTCSPCECEEGQFCHSGVCGGCQGNDRDPYICYSGTCGPCDSDAQCEDTYGLDTCDAYDTGECYDSGGGLGDDGGGDDGGIVECDTFDDGGFTWLCGGEWCDSNGCDSSGCGCEDDYDPITIDLDGLQYELTSFQNGVLFDFFNKGSMTQMAWTAKGWNGGFLALDRNGNGKIDNGTELFGNVTPQTPVPGKTPNGFLALAEFDKTANGGNGDGQIDARDAIFPKLLVWVDKNHNGVSDPGELLTLQQAGVVSISLTYSAAPWTDAYGNKFRYRANMQMTSGPTSVYDVLLGAGGKPVPVISGNE